MYTSYTRKLTKQSHCLIPAICLHKLHITQSSHTVLAQYQHQPAPNTFRTGSITSHILPPQKVKGGHIQSTAPQRLTISVCQPALLGHPVMWRMTAVDPGCTSYVEAAPLLYRALLCGSAHQNWFCACKNCRHSWTIKGKGGAT